MVSIVIVNWNSGPLLESCVRSLLRDTQDCEILVVDNASGDESLGFISSVPRQIAVIRNSENLGFAAGNNQGWRRSAGDLVLFLNPDTETLPGAVPCLVQTLLADRGIWAAGGRLIAPSGRIQAGFDVRAFPTTASLAAELLLLDELWPRNPWTCRYRMSDRDLSSVMEVDQPAAACLLVRRSALERVGGFDERFYPAWFEDVDLCRRIRNEGGRIVYQPSARFVHHGGSSLRHLPAEKFLEYYHTNQIRYFSKHHGCDAARAVRRLIIAGMWLRTAASWLRPAFTGLSRAASARAFLRAARKFSASREVAE